MNSLLKKNKFFGMIITGCLMLFSVMPVMAAGNTVETDVKDTAEADVTTSELTVDKETGGFSFQINIVSQKAYAGAEFGVICSEGTEITSVESMAGSMTGPKESNGLVWFGKKPSILIKHELEEQLANAAKLIRNNDYSKG